MAITFTSRVWFLYYDLKWNIIISNSDWWKHVNIKQIHSCSNRWIIKHKNTLGSFDNYMYKYLCLSFIIYIIIAIVVCITAGKYMLYFLDIFAIFPIMLTLLICPILLCIMPEYDAFNIRYELNIIVTIWTVSGFIFAFIESQGLGTKYDIVAIINSCVVFIYAMSITYMSTLYPINYLAKHKNREQNDVNTKTELWSDYICES
eukprot:491851_1